MEWQIVSFVVFLALAAIAAIALQKRKRAGAGEEPWPFYAASRQSADASKNKALASADVNVVRWNVKSLPDETAIRTAFTS